MDGWILLLERRYRLMRLTQKVPSEMGPTVSVTDPTGATQLDPPHPPERRAANKPTNWATSTAQVKFALRIFHGI